MKLHALIAGGGIGGLVAALCLARHGARVEVFEQSAGFSQPGAGIQLSPNCVRVLHRLELEQALRAVASLPEGIEMRDWKSGRILSSNRLGSHAIRRYGEPYYHIHRADLLKVLLDAATDCDAITLHTQTRVTAFSQDAGGVEAATSAGKFTGDLLIGADGIHSTVRSLLFGPQSPQFTGNVAWRALVPADRLPPDFIRPVASAWWGPGKHFVHYFVRRGELVNCVCVVEKAGWEVESWTQRGERFELQADFAGWHDTVTTLIANMDESECFKWALFDRPPMPQWSRGRVTLLGDACHPTLPFMAQGAAMAIEDAAVLARSLAAAEVAELPESLKQYEDKRRRRTARIQAGSRRNAKVFHLSGIAAWLRNRAVRQAGENVMDWLYRYDPLAADD